MRVNKLSVVLLTALSLFGCSSEEEDLLMQPPNESEAGEVSTPASSSATNPGSGPVHSSHPLVAAAASEVSFTEEFITAREESGYYTAAIELTEPASKMVSLPFTLSGLAQQGADYRLARGTQNPVEIPAGAVRAGINLEILPDNLLEGGETVVITLGDPKNALLGELSATTIIIPGNVGLNDTGVVSWYDGTDFKDVVPNADYPGQDAEFGIDASGNEPAFDGASGFKFTKLDKHGNALHSDEPFYSCVRDERTGLVWEAKQPNQALPRDNGDAVKEKLATELEEAAKKGFDKKIYKYIDSHSNYRAANYRYYWHNKDMQLNGGDPGPVGPLFAEHNIKPQSEPAKADGEASRSKGEAPELEEGTSKPEEEATTPAELYIPPISKNCAFPVRGREGFSEANVACNTQVYIDYLNSVGFCGFIDFRLPTISELQSLINYRATAEEWGEINYFPNTYPEGEYITGTTSAEAEASTWCLDVSKNQIRYCNKHLPHHIRLVRGDKL